MAIAASPPICTVGLSVFCVPPYAHETGITPLINKSCPTIARAKAPVAI